MSVLADDEHFEILHPGRSILILMDDCAVVDAAQEMINDVLRRRRNKQKGRDLRYTLEVTFEEAAFGASDDYNPLSSSGKPPGCDLPCGDLWPVALTEQGGWHF